MWLVTPVPLVVPVPLVTPVLFAPVRAVSVALRPTQSLPRPLLRHANFAVAILSKPRGEYDLHMTEEPAKTPAKTPAKASEETVANAAKTPPVPTQPRLTPPAPPQPGLVQPGLAQPQVPQPALAQSRVPQPVPQRRRSPVVATVAVIVLVLFGLFTVFSTWFLGQTGLEWNPYVRVLLSLCMLVCLLISLAALITLVVSSLGENGHHPVLQASAALLGTLSFGLVLLGGSFLTLVSGCDSPVASGGNYYFRCGFLETYYQRAVGPFFMEKDGVYTLPADAEENQGLDPFTPGPPTALPSENAHYDLPESKSDPNEKYAYAEPVGWAEVGELRYVVIQEDTASGIGAYGLYREGKANGERTRVADMPNGGFYELFFATPEIGYASYDPKYGRAGNAGSPETGLYITQDGGQTWQELALPYPKDWPLEGKYLETCEVTGEIGQGGQVVLVMNYPYWTVRGDGLKFASADGVTGWSRQ